MRVHPLTRPVLRGRRRVRHRPGHQQLPQRCLKRRFRIWQRLVPARRQLRQRLGQHREQCAVQRRPRSAALAPLAPAPAASGRPHPRPHDHLCQCRRIHHLFRQRAHRWRNVRLPCLGQRHVRGCRGPPALSDRGRALGRLAPRAPRRPDDLQALRRAGRLECQPRRSLHLRELRTALRRILSLFCLATAEPSVKLVAAICLTSMQPSRAIPAPPTAALALTS